MRLVILGSPKKGHEMIYIGKKRNLSYNDPLYFVYEFASLSVSVCLSVSLSLSVWHFVNPTFRQPCPFPLLPLPNPTRLSSFLWGCFEYAESLRGMISISFRILKTFCRTYNLVTLVSTDITRPVDHQTFAWQTDRPTNQQTYQWTDMRCDQPTDLPMDRHEVRWGT